MDQKWIPGEEDAPVFVRRLTAAERGAETEQDSIETEPGLTDRDGSGSTRGLTGKLGRRDGARLVIHPDALQPNPGYRVGPGDLVEVRSSRFLYLGQVRALRGGSLTIVLEHSVEIAALENIQRIWNRPGAAGTE